MVQVVAIHLEPVHLEPVHLETAAGVSRNHAGVTPESSRNHAGVNHAGSSALSRAVSDEGCAGVVAACPAREHDRGGILYQLTAQAGEKPAHHATVDGTYDRVGRRCLAERALLCDHRCGGSPVLCVGSEALGGESVRDGVHGSARNERCPSPGSMRSARARPYFSPTRSAIRSASSGPSSGQGLAEKRDQQVVATAEQLDGRVRAPSVSRSVTLGRPSRSCRRGSFEGYLEVATGRQPVEVVPGDVRVKREHGGDLRGGGAGRRPDVQIYLASGGIAERGGDGRDGRGESAVGGGGRDLIVGAGPVRAVGPDVRPSSAPSVAAPALATACTPLVYRQAAGRPGREGYRSDSRP